MNLSKINHMKHTLLRNEQIRMMHICRIKHTHVYYKRKQKSTKNQGIYDNACNKCKN